MRNTKLVQGMNDQGLEQFRLELGQSWSEGGVGGGGGGSRAGDVPLRDGETPLIEFFQTYRSDSDDADIIDVELVSEKKRIMSLVYDCRLFLAKVVFLTFGIHYALLLLKNYLLQ